MIRLMKKANSFQTANVQPRGAAYLLSDFLLISAWRYLLKCCLLKKRVFIIILRDTEWKQKSKNKRESKMIRKQWQT